MIDLTAMTNLAYIQSRAHYMQAIHLGLATKHFVSHMTCCLCQAQAYGAKNYDLVGHVWQRAMIILGLVCFPICGILLAIEKLLLLGGQTAAVAAMTAAYVRWAVPVHAHEGLLAWQ